MRGLSNRTGGVSWTLLELWQFRAYGWGPFRTRLSRYYDASFLPCRLVESASPDEGWTLFQLGPVRDLRGRQVCSRSCRNEGQGRNPTAYDTSSPAFGYILRPAWRRPPHIATRLSRLGVALENLLFFCKVWRAMSPRGWNLTRVSQWLVAGPKLLYFKLFVTRPLPADRGVPVSPRLLHRHSEEHACPRSSGATDRG